MNLSKIYQTAIVFESISICASSGTNGAGPLRGSLKEKHGVLKLEVGHAFGKEMTYDCQMIAVAAIDEAYNEIMDNNNQDLGTHLEAASFTDEEVDEVVENDDVFLQRGRERYGYYWYRPYKMNMWIGYTGGYGCRMCGGAATELENKENVGNLGLIESLGNKHDDFQKKVKDVLLTSHCDAFTNITLVNVSNAANPLDAILTSDESQHDTNPQINNFVPTSKYGVDAVTPLRGSSTLEGAGTMLKKKQGVLKVEIDHVFSKAMTYDCQTIAGAAIAEAYNSIMDDENDIETQLEESIFIDEEMDDMVESGDLKAYIGGALWLRTYYFLNYSTKECRKCRRYGDKLEDGENLENLDPIDRLGNKHDDFQKKVKDILLDSYCGAFANITLVEVSNALVAADDLVSIDDSNRDNIIKIN